MNTESNRMTEDQKIEKIKARINALISINLEAMKEIAKDHGTNNIGYAMYMGAYDDLKIVLDEIESGEIYEVQK